MWIWIWCVWFVFSCNLIKVNVLKCFKIVKCVIVFLLFLMIVCILWLILEWLIGVFIFFLLWGIILWIKVMYLCNDVFFFSCFVNDLWVWLFLVIINSFEVFLLIWWIIFGCIILLIVDKWFVWWSNVFINVFLGCFVEGWMIMFWGLLIIIILLFL